MLLWIVLALMTGAAVMAVLWPLSAAAEGRDDDRDDVSFYRDQMREIERDAERGLLSPREADSARAEAGRRLLKARAAVVPAGAATGEPALRRRRAAAAGALSIVPLIGLAVYGGLGSPHLAAEPPPGVAPGGDLAGALARIEAHLAESPNDGRGWEVIAPVYLRAGRPADAAKAYAAARRIGGETAERLNGYGEALVMTAGGVVTAEAAVAFRRALVLEPGAPRSRFYLALAAEQDGDLPRARAEYGAIIADAPKDAPWLPIVQARLASLADAPPTLARLAPEAVTPEVRAMVDGLDRRLATGGGSEPDWARLVRSFAVIGRREEALDRLGRARTALAGEPGASRRLDALAADLGLAGEGGAAGEGARR